MTEVKILEKKESPLLNRTEVSAEIVYSGATPKNEEVKAKIASALSQKENLVVIKSIYTSFGHTKAKVSAYVYANEKEMAKIEPKKKEKKKKGAAVEEKK